MPLFSEKPYSTLSAGEEYIMYHFWLPLTGLVATGALGMGGAVGCWEFREILGFKGLGILEFRV